MDGYNIEHLCCTSKSSSGASLLNFDNNRFIGIHKGVKKILSISLGAFLKLPIEKFIEKYINYYWY